jgi:hypothetical protein
MLAAEQGARAMKGKWLAGVAIFAARCVASLSFGGAALAASARASGKQPTSAQGEKTVSYHAKGTFEPTVAPAGPEDKAEGSTLGRWSLSKKFHGDLEATSEGQMLGASTNVKGSAGYVATERVTGTLGGRHGVLSCSIPGRWATARFSWMWASSRISGSGQLAGIAGTMTIQIASDGRHSYQLDYTLPLKDSGQWCVTSDARGVKALRGSRLWSP